MSVWLLQGKQQDDGLDGRGQDASAAQRQDAPAAADAAEHGVDPATERGERTTRAQALRLQSQPQPCAEQPQHDRRQGHYVSTPSLRQPKGIASLR